MTTYATEIYEGDGSTTQFAVNFSFIQRSHVEVYRVVKSTSAETTLSVVTSGSPTGDQYIWDTDEQIQVGTAPADTEEIKIVRTTPVDEQLVQWRDGSFIVAEDLNTSDQQFLYLIQELDDRAGADEDAAVPEAPDNGKQYGRQSKGWTETLPDAPSDGKEYSRKDGAWQESAGFPEAPQDSYLYGRENAGWKKVPDPGIEEAPIDNKEYVRVNQSWKEIPDDQTGVPEAPINTKTFARKDASWVEISSTGGINYKGTRDLTLAAPTAIAGDFYVNTATTGVVAASWTGIAGDTLEGAERVVYNGSTWEMLPMPPAPAGVVEEVVAGNDITVNSGNPAQPVVSVKDGVFLKSFEVKAGTDITVVGGDTVSVTNNSFLPYDISTLAALPTP